ncbi:MAG: hypothetical protein MJ107_03075 [Lachnospiraceae bacterium]|nr:hypothetical protein [Lachnospiraceae bacterium]
MNSNIIKAEIDNLNLQITEITEQIKHFPPGKLRCYSSGKYIKWFVEKNGKRKYLKRSQSSLAQELANKLFFSTLLMDLKKQKNAAEQYLKVLNEPECTYNLLSNRCYSPLLKNTNLSHKDNLNLKNIPIDACSENIIQAWLNQEPDSPPIHPESLIHKTISGHMVRSKSEVLIATCLSSHGIPFKYEFPLNINGVTYHPDFTVMHPKTLKIYYWEHFGLMDNITYKDNALHKISNYCSNGIYPSDQLIMTFETSLTPLNVNEIERIISQFFL